MRFVVAMMQHETNTFSPLFTPYEAFAEPLGLTEPPRGEAAIRHYQGTNWPFAAFLDIAREHGAEIVVPIAANAEPSGKVADDAFERIADAICQAVAGGCDAVMLDLHGAMVTESHDDGEGELLRRLRKIAPAVPVAVALDFHANLTDGMIRNATVITGYRTYPHVDMYETGLRAGRTLIRALKGEVRPVMAWRSLPMLTHMLRQTPAEQPMKDIMGKALEAEASGTVLNASLFGGFPLADIPHVGLGAIVVVDANAGAADALLEDVMQMAWERRSEFVFRAEALEDSIARAKSLKTGPIILVDHGDNCGAGGNQDVMRVIEEVLSQRLEDVVAGPIWDPQAVAEMIAAGVGSEITLQLGGKTDMPALNLKGKPLDVRGVVRRITDGKFTVTGPMMTGSEVNLGRTVVLDTGPVQIVVSEQRCEPFDTGVFTHAGLDPVTKKYVLIKSRQHFRAGFEPIASHIVLVAGPGVCSSDYSAFPFRKLRRPIYPLDSDAKPDA